MPIGEVLAYPCSVSREIAKAAVGSGLWASWTRMRPADILDSGDTDAAGRGSNQATAPAGESDRLAMHQRNGVIAGVAAIEGVERAVVEDRAVLVDLDQCGAAMRRRGQYRGEVLAVGVDRARHERRFGAQRQGDRVERVIDRADRGRFGDLPGFGGW